MIINLKKVLRQFIFFVCFLLCLYEILQCIKRLRENPTTTIIYFEEFGKHGAPSITVCAYNNHLGNGTSYKTDKLAENNLTLNDYVKESIWWSNSSDVSPEQLYEEIAWTLDDLVDRIEYTFKDRRYTLNATNVTWNECWTETNKKWEGRCFTFNPTSTFNGKGLIRFDIISKFQFDLEVAFHAKHQATDKELDGISFIAKYRQYYELEVPVDIIMNRKTDTISCIDEEDNFDAVRNKIAVDKMMEEVGCVVPFIDRNEDEAKICTNKTSADIAVDIFESNGPYYDLYNWKQVPLPCKQIHVVPRKALESPEWNHQTWINGKFMKISKVTEQQASYSFTTFYAEVGGFVGLLLGISVHQVAMLLDFIPDF